MLDFYAPPDVILAHRDMYNSMKQHQEESVDQYYLRFSEAVSNLDDPPKETWQVSDFIRGLQPSSAKQLASFVDLVDFKNVTVEQVNERLTRAIRLGAGCGNRGGGSDGNSSRGRSGGTSGHESELPEHRVSKKLKQKFKHPSQPSSVGKSTLTSEQKRRVEELLRKDGGEFVGQAIRDNSEWYALSREKNVCRNCAANGHIARDCPLGPKTRHKGGSGGSGNLNAILSGLVRLEKAMNVGNSTDFPYLCSLAEDIPLAMFPCTVDGSSLGVALLDDGATRNYVSLAYAKRARLRIQELSDMSSKPIRLPNGQRMKVYGTTEFELEISEWRGKVQATVLDLQADFDVVLGME
jgi:aspartyl protease/zinc knuckle protein